MASKRDFSQAELPQPDTKPPGSSEHMVTLGEILAQYPAPQPNSPASKAGRQSDGRYHNGKNTARRAIKTGVWAGIVIGCTAVAVLLIVGD